MNQTGRWVPRFVYAPLALVPFTVLLVMVIRYGVDVPYLDGWELVPLFEKLNQHTLTFRDLWLQHNEHRLIFPQIIMLALARMTSWNITWELATSLVLAFATFTLLVRQVEAIGNTVENRWVTLVIPGISVLVFSFRQWENWLWGWQLQMYLNALAIVGSICLLANPPFRWWRLASSMGLAIVAVYSFANGMMIWPIGLVILTLAPQYASTRWKCLGLWLLVGGLTATSYLFQYQTPVQHPPLDFVFGHFREYIDYTLSYLGSPTSTLVDASRQAGIVVTLLTVISIFALLRMGYVKLGPLLPYIGITLYVFGSALMTGLGRAGFGVEQALAPRYNTYSGLLWSCNLVFLALIAVGRKTTTEGQRRGRTRKVSKPEGRSTTQVVLGVLAVACMVWVVVQTGQASLQDVSQFTDRSEYLKEGRKQVVRMLGWTDPSMYEPPLLYPRQEVIVPRAKIMAERRWSVFRSGLPEDSGQSD